MFSKKREIKKRTLIFPVSSRQKVVGASRRSTARSGSGFWSRLLFYFLLLVFFLTLGFLILFSELLRVTQVEISGNNQVARETLEEMVDSRISGKYLNFLEKNNLLLFSSRHASDEIKDHFRIIKSVTIKKKFPDRLDVSIVERHPALIFKAKDKGWVVDDQGTIFDEASDDLSYLGNGDLPVFYDTSNQEFSLGDSPLPKEYLDFIFDFRRQAEDISEVGFSREIETPGVFSGDIRMKTRDGWTILLDEDLGAEREAEMLQVVLDNKIEKEARANLEYIDLRTANKVYYKFKNSPDQTEDDGKKTEGFGESYQEKN